MIGPVIIGVFVLVAVALIGGVGAPDPRFTPCVRCDHLQIEHARGGKRCDVREPEEDPSPCKCQGFKPRGGFL